jgi:glycerol uptake facilitator-like aquaporin
MQSEGILTGGSFPALFQIGLAYGGGIFFAVGLCAATSGGHLNPCITIVHVLFKGFPPLKALRFVFPHLLLI